MLSQSLVTEKCSVDDTGISFSDSITYAEWQGVGNALWKMEKLMPWMIGDWLNFGEWKYGEMYAQAVDETGLDRHTLMNYKWVSSRIPKSRRRESIDFSTHSEIAKYEPEKQDKFLDQAEGLNRREMRALVKQTENPRPILPGSKATISLRNEDFRHASIADNSIDLILTDPPYPGEYLPLWSDLSRLAYKWLKPGGFLIAYSGNGLLPEYIAGLGAYLEFYWIATLYHEGQAGQRFETNMFNRGKPILIYYKPPLTKQSVWLDDVIHSPSGDKSMHEWGQSVAPFEKLLDAFSEEGQTVLDPFAGGGAVIEAAANTNRHVIGIEIDKTYYDLINRRLSDPS